MWTASSPMPYLPRVSQFTANVLDILTTVVHHSVFTPFTVMVFLGSDLLLSRGVDICISKSVLGWIKGTRRRADNAKPMGISQKVRVISHPITKPGL